MSCMDETAARRLQAAAEEILKVDQTQSEAQLRRYLGLPPRESAAAIPIPDGPKLGRILTHDDVRAIVREEIERLAGWQRGVVGAADTLNQYAFDSVVAAEATNPRPQAPRKLPEGPRKAAEGLMWDRDHPTVAASLAGASSPRRDECAASRPTTRLGGQTEPQAQEDQAVLPPLQQRPSVQPHEKPSERAPSIRPDGAGTPDSRRRHAASECTASGTAADSRPQSSPRSVGVGTPSVGDGRAAEGDLSPSAAEPPGPQIIWINDGALAILGSPVGALPALLILSHGEAHALLADLAEALTT